MVSHDVWHVNQWSDRTAKSGQRRNTEKRGSKMGLRGKRMRGKMMRGNQMDTRKAMNSNNTAKL